MTITVADRRRELLAMVREGHVAAFVDRACTVPPADVADVLGALPVAARATLMPRLPAGLAAHALLALAREMSPAPLLLSLRPEQAARMIAELEDDDAADLLGALAPEARQRILACLDDPASLRRLLDFSARSAGGLMTSRMVTVTDVDTIAIATEAVRRQAAAIGALGEIFVLDTARRLVGQLPVRQLLLVAPATVVRDVMGTVPVRVGPHEDQQVVARVIARYNLANVAVVDERDRLIGLVTAADVHEVALDDAAEGLLRFGGIPAGDAAPSWSATVRSRLPWLYANLLPAFAAAAVVYFFKDTVLRIVALAVWMPVVAGVGGNAGTQALATAVRRLVLRPEESRGLRAGVMRELRVGAANGAAIGAFVAVVAVLLGERWQLGLVIFMAIVGNLVVAGAAGAAIPIALRRLGRDPALASPVFVTALTDACGFALLLGLASLLLR